MSAARRDAGVKQRSMAGILARDHFAWVERIAQSVADVMPVGGGLDCPLRCLPQDRLRRQSRRANTVQREITLRGSSASRSPSPMWLMESTVRKIAVPGKKAQCGAKSRLSLASKRM